MGEYYTDVKVSFKGSKLDEKRFKTLLTYMDKEDCMDYIPEDGQPIYMDEVIENALLGILEDRGENSGYNCRYFPDFNLNLAPKLFAALFPESTFSIDITYEYSCGGGDTFFSANYTDGKLTVCECNEEYDMEYLSEEQKQEIEDPELCYEDELRKALIKAKGYIEIEPSRNKEYEKSFFDGDDLQACLNAIVE